MSTVIEKGDDTDAISEVRARFGATPPSAVQVFTGSDATKLNAKEKLRYEADLWEYRTRLTALIKGENAFKVECSKFYNVVMGQLSQLVEQRLEAIPNFDQDVKSIRSLGGLFSALD